MNINSEALREHLSTLDQPWLIDLLLNFIESSPFGFRVVGYESDKPGIIFKVVDYNNFTWFFGTKEYCNKFIQRMTK